MSRLPIPPALLKPAADAMLKLAADRLGKGNPLVSMGLTAIQGLIDAHGSKPPPELAPVKREISASLANDFVEMEKAAERTREAGQYRPPPTG